MTTPGIGTLPPKYTLTLERPDGISGDSWEAIAANQRRLARAIEHSDHPQAIGYAKELVESIAKTVLMTCGEVVEGHIDYPDCVSRAHQALGRQPDVLGASNEKALRKLAQSAKTIATQIGYVRNSHGTGHGRAVQPEVAEEMLHLCLDGALLWSRWALRRLGILAIGMPDALIHDLGHINFYGSDLTTRLQAADLPKLEVVVQRRIGVAVAQRAMGGTRNVRNEGVMACAESDDLKTWPAGYRFAVFEGLFIDPSGRLTVDEWSVEWCARLLAPLAEEETVSAINELRGKVSPLVDPAARDDPFARDHQLEKPLLRQERYLPVGARSAWRALAVDVAAAAYDR